jgi:glycosyltransferase involved in cell wall biosynthesis
MKEHPPLITVIVAVLNAACSLECCIKSISSQTYPHKELIVMDGGSTDGSLSIIKKYRDTITYWESRPDQGIYHAWNKALKRAEGEWICFLGADDYFWNEDVLADLLPYLIKTDEAEIRVVYGQMARIDGSGRIVKLVGKSWEKLRWLMPHGMPLPHPGLMHHRSLFENHGLFDESFRVAGDYELLLRELKTGRALYADGIRTVGNRVGGIADSFSLLTHKEVARARRKNGLTRLSWVWMIVYTRAFMRKQWQKLLKR